MATVVTFANNKEYAIIDGVLYQKVGETNNTFPFCPTIMPAMPAMPAGWVNSTASNSINLNHNIKLDTSSINLWREDDEQ